MCKGDRQGIRYPQPASPEAGLGGVVERPSGSPLGALSKPSSDQRIWDFSLKGWASIAQGNALGS
ncbi:MAG: hypothetical protein JWO38_3672 [Gemmataceae bacterium]|nr:hypothetical protein [Gemmataceae bacterium]